MGWVNLHADTRIETGVGVVGSGAGKKGGLLVKGGVPRTSEDGGGGGQADVLEYAADRFALSDYGYEIQAAVTAMTSKGVDVINAFEQSRPIEAREARSGSGEEGGDSWEPGRIRTGRAWDGRGGCGRKDL